MSRAIEKLKKCITKKEEYERRKSSLDGLDERIKEQEELLVEKKELLEKEFQDFLAMNRLSFKAVWHRLKGDHAKQLSKEENEYLLAREVAQHVEQELEALIFEREELKANTDELSAAEFQYLNALRAAVRYLIRKDDGKGRRLAQMDEEEEKMRKQIEDLYGAYSKGLSVLSTMQELLNDINRALSASNEAQWRNNDLGYSDRKKYDAINAAKNCLQKQVEPAIQRYKDELGLLNRSIDLSNILNIHSWTEQLDLYWNTFSASWEVHAIIERALSRTSKIYDKVEGVQDEIKRMRRDFRKKIEELGEQRLALVLA